MARPEQVLILEPQHELKFRGKRGGPGNGREEEEGGASATWVGNGALQRFLDQTGRKSNYTF